MSLKKFEMDGEISFISTGGGAMLDFLAGKELPGIVALQGRKPVKKQEPSQKKTHAKR